LLSGWTTSLQAAENTETAALLRSAETALRSGQATNAIELATKALMADAANARALFLRGSAYEQVKDHPRALTDYAACLKANPRLTVVWQKRGELHFRLGSFKESVTDFDKFIELAPEQSPHHWQRGISLYYAGRFDDGRKQFELHKTVNPYDVENAAWHFLCAARASTPEKARAAFIPVERDTRVPMMQIHALFAGTLQPEDVLTAARIGGLAQQDNQLFYAHLYLGLYFEAMGDAKLAREHILKAASDFKADHYMGDVARVHAAVLRKQPDASPKR
jgi:lipoprotein NlpI